MSSMLWLWVTTLQRPPTERMTPSSLAEIESLTASLRRMDSQVTYSFLNLSLQEVVEYQVMQEKPRTFGERMKEGAGGCWWCRCWGRFPWGAGPCPPGAWRWPGRQTGLEILSKAEKLEDIITLESALSDVRYQIESLTPSSLAEGTRALMLAYRSRYRPPP